jgi:hypothetical protein
MKDLQERDASRAAEQEARDAAVSTVREIY